MQTEALNISAVKTNISRPNPTDLDNLRRKINHIECGKKTKNTPPNQSGSVISFGDSKIDGELPWYGLPLTGLHEIFGDTAATGFALTIVNKISKKNLDEPILWCQHKCNLSGHGLAEFGLDPSKLILIQGKNDTDILWAMEEGLRCSGVAAIVGQPYKVSPIAGRRLQLAAEENNIPSLLVRMQNHNKNQKNMSSTSAALTRWHVTAAPSITPAIGLGLGTPKWNLELQRYRYSAFNLKNQVLKQQKTAGRITSWQVEWSHETGDLSVVTNPCNRSAKQRRGLYKK